MKTITLGFVGALLTIALFNMILFPLVFPDGVPVLYANVRSAPMFQYNLLAFVVTAAGLVALLRYGKTTSGFTAGLSVGSMVGLLVAVPTGLHTYSLTAITATSQVAPILWTLISWGLAGGVVGWVNERFTIGQT